MEDIEFPFINITSSDEEEETNRHSREIIDSEDIIIIEDVSKWEPPQNYILTYAKDLGFDIDNDPPQLINIAKKYMLRSLPNNYIRAFYRDSFHIMYINTLTFNVINEMGFEEEAKNEYKNLKNELSKNRLDIKKPKIPNDIIVISNTLLWEPPKEYILEYAKKLGFDKNNDSPQLLEEVKKIILNIPYNYKIGLKKDNYQIVYINNEYNKIYNTCHYEEEA